MTTNKKRQKLGAIFGYDIGIKYKKLDNKYGEFDTEKYDINIDETNIERDIDRDIFHEAVHAALHIGGVAYAMDNELEEAVVRCIENGLWPLLKFR